MAVDIQSGSQAVMYGSNTEINLIDYLIHMLLVWYSNRDSYDGSKIHIYGRGLE